MQRNFEDWFSTFRISINESEYHFCLKKIRDEIKNLELEMCIISTIWGENDIYSKFRFIIEKYPECMKAVPVLMDLMNYEIYCKDENGDFTHDFSNTSYEFEQYTFFLKNSGIVDLMKGNFLHNLNIYLRGIEAGLSFSAPKNKDSYFQMANLVESFIRKAGAEYYPQIYLEDIQEKWNIDLSRISAGGTSTKKFDFAVRTEQCIYAIETNFYTSGGSKLNETAQSYKMLAEESRDIEGFKFVWITDGAGWESAKHNLEETFNAMTHLYNIKDMEAGIFEKLFM